MDNKFIYPSPFFDDNVAIEIQQEIVRIVFRGYFDADKELDDADYDAPEYAYLRPNVRLARINYYLRQLGVRIPGCKATVETNEINNYTFTLLRVGNAVLTVSKVEGQGILPRTAKFRNIYAGQQSKFDIENDALAIQDYIIPPDAMLYGIILHCPVKDGKIPAFINIGFPNEHCTSFVGSIPLMKRYPEIQEEMTVEHEQIADKVTTPLKIKERKANHQARLL